MSALRIFFNAFPDLERGVLVGLLEVGVSADTALRFGTKDHILLSKGDYIFVYSDFYPSYLPAPDYCLDLDQVLEPISNKVLIWRDNFDKSID